MRRKKKIVALGLVALFTCPWTSRAGNGAVALQTADPSCANDSSAIYVDCSNGTVTDNRTGLVWLKNADCLGAVDWYTAMEVVAGLSDLQGSDPDDCGLSDDSSPGEWRLPLLGEWEAMVADAKALGCAPTITDDQGDGCWLAPPLVCGSCSFVGVVSSFYWSSTTAVNITTFAWGMTLDGGAPFGDDKSDLNHVWPVRGGQ